MILVFHIAIALSSIVFTAFSVFSPSQLKIRFSYILATLTLSSGTYLVIVNHANLVRTCFTGIVYLAIVFSGILATQRKLAKIVTT